MTEKTTVPLWRIEVAPLRRDLDSHGAAVLKDVHDLGLPGVERVASSRLYLLEAAISDTDVQRIARELLADPVTEAFTIRSGGDDTTLPGSGFGAAIEVHLKGGVMDPVAGSTLAAIADMGFDSSGMRLSTVRLYRLAGVGSQDDLEFIARRSLSNDCIEDVYLTGFGRHQTRPDHLPVAPRREFQLRRVPLRELDDAALTKLSREAHLFLSLEEMKTIQAHYRSEGRDPTDLELETFAQTWSEHCVHKTLKSAVRYRGAPLPASSKVTQRKTDAGTVELEYGNLLRDTIARATHELIDSGKIDWCLSVFEDNAGVITFDDTYGIAFKAETHNHPSAIEPYGGAATGIGGCIRDVMGCGLGAKPIANTDVFCVGLPDFPMDLLPRGVLHPRRILKGIVAGVRDYGNRMGIPTVNGAVVFDDRYLGNPLVFCGCIGLIPRDRIRKDPQPGDLVVLIGGRTGRDGIHGATFSSAELTDTHADEFSHAVQIGNAITEKQVLDAMMRARDYGGRCLYTATTDCGAGGLSSAVGEMGQKLGATVDLEKVPLKYAGLRYDEIWISEAQERMVLSVPPENWPDVRRICEAENVEATVIGTFRSDGRLLIRYDSQVVGDIQAELLHHGIPKTRREATWSPDHNAPIAASSPTPDGAAAPRGGRAEPLDNPDVLKLAAKELAMASVDLTTAKIDPGLLRDLPTDVLLKHTLLPISRGADTLRTATADPFNLVGLDELRLRTRLKIEPVLASPAQIRRLLQQHLGVRDSLLHRLSTLNAASKEWIIRQYDHEVQGASVVKPLVGPGQGPSDAAVIRPRLDSRRAIAISSGICPHLSDVDPYWMAVAAIDEAIRNVVCVGGDPRRTAILDNFCWGNCEDPQTMGALVRACQACYDAAITHEVPFISGKDSLNNEFALDPADAKRLAGRVPLHNNRVRIPGTLLVSAISVIDDASRCITMDARPAANSVFWFVGLDAPMWRDDDLPKTARLHREVARLIHSGCVLAAHDVGEDGIAATVAEMAFAGRCGVTLEPGRDLLAPVTSGYILQCETDSADGVKAVAPPSSGLSACIVARLSSGATLAWPAAPGGPLEIPVTGLDEAWRAPLRW